MSKRRRPVRQASRRAYLKKHSTRFNPIWRKLANDVPFDYDLSMTKYRNELNESAWISNFHQGVDQWYLTKLQDGKYNKLHMYHSGNRYYFEKIYLSSLGEQKHKSIEYPSRDMAMLRYNTNTIHWGEGELTTEIP